MEKEKGDKKKKFNPFRRGKEKGEKGAVDTSDHNGTDHLAPLPDHNDERNVSSNATARPSTNDDVPTAVASTNNVPRVEAASVDASHATAGVGREVVVAVDAASVAGSATDAPSTLSSQSQSAMKANLIAQSAGTIRLNRILRATNTVDSHTPTRPLTGTEETASAPPKMERVSHPTKVSVVADFAAKVVIPPLQVDPRSIGGRSPVYPVSMQQETLSCFKCRSFEATGPEIVAPSALEYFSDYAKHKRSLGLFDGIGTSKNRNKLRYVLLARSTNQPLVAGKTGVPHSRHTSQDMQEESSTNFGYDTLYSPDPELDPEEKNTSDLDPDISMMKEMDVDGSIGNSAEDTILPGTTNTNGSKSGTTAASNNMKQSSNNIHHNNNNGNELHFRTDDPMMEDDEEEVSSFPALVCVTFHSDGTTPDIRKLIQLDKLATVQDLQGSTVQLIFVNGDTVRIDFGEDEDPTLAPQLDKERFVWFLLQIHAMLCVSVVERTSLAGNGASNATVAHQQENQLGAPETENTHLGLLPPINVRNIDRAELQYLATVNHFIRDSESIQILLGRQRRLAEMFDTPTGAGEVGTINENEELDSIAYDLIMGNFATRIAIFHNEEERKNAEQVLNSTEWTYSLNSEDTAAATAAERLSQVLQKRMRDLEAETCRRLIGWEDEKCFSATHKSKGNSESEKSRQLNNPVDASSLASLFTTLDSLDNELHNMESWLQTRAAAIKPITEDCRHIEVENRQLQQQWKSYEKLSEKMKQVLYGLQLGADTEKILNNPASALVYKKDGAIDINASEDGKNKVIDAGKRLQTSIRHVHQCGGIHLKAVRQRADALEATKSTYCTALAQIIVTVMEQFKTEVVAGSDHGKVSKSDTHTMISRKIRSTQKKFQNLLLGYIKLIEILAELSPELLPAVRDAYSEMVAEGIMMKKRMKGYFQALPGKNASYLKNVSKDLKDYIPFELITEETVHADDIRYSLNESLPVISIEAYFTAALFGLSSKAQDGREKKRNFEAAKKSVDHSSQYFNYYIQRTCGIIQDFDPEGSSTTNQSGGPKQNSQGDSMLCLVASIHLNEEMGNYIDREKKGGDHSLSLAYVRATILELRKKVDKQWVAWVDKQIKWIRSHPGVPANGKRAGIIQSFSRFPCYLDHILLCCREGRKADLDYEPGLANIKVVSYYLQKMATALIESLRECAERETTDKQYGSKVMQMENTYYFTQCIKQRGPGISTLFKKQVTKANDMCKRSTDEYLGWMIKREFTSLHELFSKISKTRREYGDRQVNAYVSKTIFVRTLTKDSSREVLKEKIGVLHTRMGKHLSEEGGLLPVAWKALVKVLYEWFGRWEKLAIQCYSHKLDPSAVDVVRIAKSAGSTSSRRYNDTNVGERANYAGTGTPGALVGVGSGAGVGIDEPGKIIPGRAGINTSGAGLNNPSRINQSSSSRWTPK